MRWPLRYQILVPFAGVMLAVVLGISLLDAALSARHSQRQIEAQLRQVASTLAEARFPLTDAVLKQTRGLSGAEFVLVDAQHQVLAASDASIAFDSRRMPAEVKSSAQLGLSDSVVVGGRDFLHAAVPIAGRANPSGDAVLHILFPRDQLRLARWEAASPPLVVGGLLLVVVTLLAFAIADRLSRPIVQLRSQLGQLAAGDFQPLPLPQRNDELQDLVRSANSLGAQLAELRTVIKRNERLSLLGQLSGGLAHQLRNTVTGARLAMQLHGRRCSGIDDDSLQVALRQLTITETHLQRFLSAGRPSAPCRAACDLAGIIDDVSALVTPACKHHKVRLELPDAATAPLWADAEQLRQLLVNLVLNAIEAASPHGWVRVECDDQPDAVVLRVLDSGSGPAPEVVDRLFEPFVTGKREGIGLGLTVARQIVSAHEGTLRLVPGGPTCFKVTLPKNLRSEVAQPDVAATTS
jgi:signal transduction histidine kinase